jgi:hypothetical protein
VKFEYAGYPGMWMAFDAELRYDLGSAIGPCLYHSKLDAPVDAHILSMGRHKWLYRNPGALPPPSQSLIDVTVTSGPVNASH